MFVGETGVRRVVAAHVRADEASTRPTTSRALGGIDLPTIQKYLNFWYSLSLDLFGGEVSSNAADFFAAGLKGRAKEDAHEDHRARAARTRWTSARDGAVVDARTCRCATR